MDSLVSCSLVISNVCASKVTGPEPSLWECSGIHHICPAEHDYGSELMVYFHGKEDTNLYLEHPITQAESTVVTVTSLGFKPISNLITENKSKQIPPAREPRIEEFQETKSFSGNSSITNHHSIADEPMDTIHRLEYSTLSTVNCLAIRD